MPAHSSWTFTNNFASPIYLSFLLASHVIHPVGVFVTRSALSIFPQISSCGCVPAWDASDFLGQFRHSTSSVPCGRYGFSHLLPRVGGIYSSALRILLNHNGVEFNTAYLVGLFSPSHSHIRQFASFFDPRDWRCQGLHLLISHVVLITGPTSALMDGIFSILSLFYYPSLIQKVPTFLILFPFLS